MLLQRGPVILSGNSMPQSVEGVEPKISQIVDLIDISCKTKDVDCEVDRMEDVLNGNVSRASSLTSQLSEPPSVQEDAQTEEPWQNVSIDMEDASHTVCEKENSGGWTEDSSNLNMHAEQQEQKVQNEDVLMSREEERIQEDISWQGEYTEVHTWQEVVNVEVPYQPADEEKKEVQEVVETVEVAVRQDQEDAESKQTAEETERTNGEADQVGLEVNETVTKRHKQDTDTNRRSKEMTGSLTDSYETQLEISLELKKGELERGETPVRNSIHRVTFNTRNEVASEDTDGSLLVTYCPLEEKIKRRERSPLPGREPIKVKYVDRTNPVSTAARFIDFTDSTFIQDPTHPNLDTSSESEGWENPFQPEGEVSQDADLILRLWKGGNLDQNLGAAINQLQVETEKTEDASSSVAGSTGSPTAETAGPPPTAETPDAGTTAGVSGSPTSARLQTKEDVKPDRISSDTRLVHIDKQKHKHQLKKYCSLM